MMTEDISKKAKNYRRAVVIYAFFMLLWLGFIIIGRLPAGSSTVDSILNVFAPLSFAFFGAMLVECLLSYFESILGVKK